MPPDIDEDDDIEEADDDDSMTVKSFWGGPDEIEA